MAGLAGVRSRPPSLPGLPVVGNLLQYRQDHLAVFWRGYRELGRIFSIRLGPKRAVVLIGPEHHAFFFREVDRTLSMRGVYEFVVPMFGRVLNAAEPETRKKQLSILHDAFIGDRMTAHVNVMVDETERWMEELGDRGELEVWDAVETLTMRVAARALLGPEVRANLAEFVPLVRDLAAGMEFVLPPDLPLPRFRRRDRARARLTEMLLPLIRERQRGGAGRDDVLQWLASARYPDGTPIPEHAIVGLTLLTLFTGYISTAAQLTWALTQLLENPWYLAEVREEVLSVGMAGGAALDVDDLARMERLGLALRETERMHPVMSHYARFNERGYSVDGFDVPAGWLTMLCPAVAHRLPEVFRNPHAYDPGRFSPPRREDRSRYSLIGFGGGVYRCPGARFGLNEMKVVLALLARRYELELRTRVTGADFRIGIVRPDPPVRVSYMRRGARVQGARLEGAPVPARRGAAPEGDAPTDDVEREVRGRCPVTRSSGTIPEPAAQT